jgi:hypothetical protein
LRGYGELLKLRKGRQTTINNMKNYQMRELEGVGWIALSPIPFSEKLIALLVVIALVAGIGAIIYSSFPF